MDLFCKRDGRWSLTLEGVRGPESEAVRALAKLLGLTEERARIRLRRLPESAPMLVGVKAVIQEAAAFLAERGIVVRADLTRN